MTAKIVTLPDIPGEKDEACKRMVERIMYLEDSPLQSVAIVAVRNDGSVASGYRLGGSPFVLAGAIEMLQHRIYTERVEKSEN